MPKTKVRFFLSEPSANFSDPRACLKIKALFKIHVFFFFFFTPSPAGEVPWPWRQRQNSHWDLTQRASSGGWGLLVASAPLQKPLEVVLQVKPEPFTPSLWEIFCGGFGTRHPLLQQLGARQLPTLVPVLLARGLRGSALTTGSPQRAVQAVQPAASAIWRVTTSCCDIRDFFPVEDCVCKCDARFLGCRQPVGNFAPVKTNWAEQVSP